MTEHKEAYLIYLDSQEWQDKREKLFEKRGKKCQVCKSTEHTEVHHLTYARLGFELMEDLAVVCRSCHKQIHQLGGGRCGYEALKNPAKAKKKQKKALEKLKRKNFATKMLSGPVTIIRKKKDIAALNLGG